MTISWRHVVYGLAFLLGLMLGCWPGPPVYRHALLGKMTALEWQVDSLRAGLEYEVAARIRLTAAIDTLAAQVRALASKGEQ